MAEGNCTIRFYFLQTDLCREARFHRQREGIQTFPVPRIQLHVIFDITHFPPARYTKLYLLATDCTS